MFSGGLESEWSATCAECWQILRTARCCPQEMMHDVASQRSLYKDRRHRKMLMSPIWYCRILPRPVSCCFRLCLTCLMAVLVPSWGVLGHTLCWLEPVLGCLEPFLGLLGAASVCLGLVLECHGYVLGCSGSALGSGTFLYQLKAQVWEHCILCLNAVSANPRALTPRPSLTSIA